MADATITSVEELKQHIGKQTRLGEWHTVTQEEINQFAEATGDHQWIHVDPERARALGIDAWLAKPWQAHELARTIQWVLEERRREQG